MLNYQRVTGWLKPTAHESQESGLGTFAGKSLEASVAGRQTSRFFWCHCKIIMNDEDPNSLIMTYHDYNLMNSY